MAVTVSVLAFMSCPNRAPSGDECPCGLGVGWGGRPPHQALRVPSSWGVAERRLGGGEEGRGGRGGGV